MTNLNFEQEVLSRLDKLDQDITTTNARLEKQIERTDERLEEIVKRWDERFFQLSRDNLNISRTVIVAAASVVVLANVVPAVLEFISKLLSQ